LVGPLPHLSPIAVLLVVALGGLARADDLPGDAKIAMPMLLKALTYDVNFDARGLGDFTVLVIGDATQADKRSQLIAALKDLPSQKVKARPLKYAVAEFKDEAALQAELERTKASALLIVPGAAPATVKHVWEVAQDNQTYVMALEASMVESGLPLGVQVTGGKPQIVINEKGAKSIGAKFETGILKLARVIQ
jgi:hypothetical protein